MTSNRLDARCRPWTKDDIRRARRRPIKPVIERLGCQLNEVSGGNWKITTPAGCIILKQHYWICPESGQAGNAIDFMMRIMDMSFNQAVSTLLKS